jgi:hypothetical protein
MRRLTREETAAYVARLRSWLPLSEVDAIIREVSEKAEFYAVSQGGLKFWRETFVGMSCAILTHAKLFRLGGDPPDFELDYGDHTRSFEIVDVMPAARRLGDEYGQFAVLANANQGVPIRHVTQEEMEAELNALAPDLEQRLTAKMAKNYNPAPILVVDIHHDIIPAMDSGPERTIVLLAKRALSKFPEVWLRKSSSFIRVSSLGVSRISMPWPDDC